jgi:divalent metal cation (Fe/Co/Zn/Cd) transporter
MAAMKITAIDSAVLRIPNRKPIALDFPHHSLVVAHVRTDEGLLAYLTLGLDPASPLAEAHARASEIEERIRRARPDIADVIVHTEP